MSVVAILRRLRHGPLRFLSPVWTRLGNLYRRHIPHGFLTLSSHRIGRYGPFEMSGEFAFSDFENWGERHNSGFEFCVEASRDKACMLDIGAHIGLVTMPVSQVLAPADRCLPSSRPRRTADAATPYTCNAIENVTWSILWWVTRSRGYGVLRACRGQRHEHARAHQIRDEYVETHHTQTTLDAFCRTQGIRPDVIKIDVEGAEFAVLEGAREILAEARPLLVVSIHPQH